jgi:hypothetical protein
MGGATTVSTPAETLTEAAPAPSETPPETNPNTPVRVAWTEDNRFHRKPFRVAHRPGQTRVFIPVRGRLKHPEVLELSPKPGVSVIFPNGRAYAKRGRFRVRIPAIYAVWIEDRPLGLYIRVLFGEAARRHDVEIMPGGLMVTVDIDSEGTARI